MYLICADTAGIILDYHVALFSIPLQTMSIQTYTTLVLLLIMPRSICPLRSSSFGLNISKGTHFQHGIVSWEVGLDLSVCITCVLNPSVVLYCPLLSVTAAAVVWSVVSVMLMLLHHGLTKALANCALSFVL